MRTVSPEKPCNPAPKHEARPPTMCAQLNSCHKLGRKGCALATDHGREVCSEGGAGRRNDELLSRGRR
jgi:hypothetical protein